MIKDQEVENYGIGAVRLPLSIQYPFNGRGYGLEKVHLPMTPDLNRSHEKALI